MKFDARIAKQLKPGSHLTFASFPGLRLEVTTSRRSWIYRYKSPIDKCMRQKKLGQWPEMSYASAISAWEEIRGQREAGIDPVLAKKRPKDAGKGYTVKQLCEDFLSGYIDVHRQADGARLVRQRMLKKIKPIEKLQAAEITRMQAFDLLNSERHAPRNAAVLRSELGAAWDYALDAARIPPETPNWWRLIMARQLRSKGRIVAGTRVTEKRILTDKELSILIPWLKNFSPTIADVLTMYLWTALRGGEIVAIQGKYIAQEDDGTWLIIPKVTTKNKNRSSAHDHRVPLVGRALEIIARRKEEYGDGYLFPTDIHKHIPQKSVQAIVWNHQPYALDEGQTLRPVLPVSHWSAHDLRRTSRTILASLGCPHEVGEVILGHVIPGVAGVYNKYRYDKERREWLTKLSDYLEGLAPKIVQEEANRK
ncbi:tyrosine-type recombinase/integrase [Burkholderia gladioli]|uniref:tyrosine-type recombinase/integrase n=1 Tax=Burkholderia gladioli TaxID=28095 RepID=UPI00163E846F|nr:integrase family protein [Burkholderia gladioli]